MLMKSGFPRRFVVSDHTANLQFVAALLRLTDILDFDFERTPRVLFDSLGLKHKTLPGSEVSIQEWEKHLAVQQLEIRDSETIVKARCKHPAIEASGKAVLFYYRGGNQNHSFRPKAQ